MNTPNGNTRCAILLSTYNGDQWLEQLRASLEKLTGPDFDLWIRDDGSTDNTIGYIRAWQQENRDRGLFPVHILEDNENLRPRGSFSRLSQAALDYSNREYQYFFYCDQDDVWLPAKLEIFLNRAHEFPVGQPLLLYSDLTVTGPDISQVLAKSLWRFQGIHPERNQLSWLLLQNPVTGCASMVNRVLLRKALPFPPEAIMHDWWLALVASLEEEGEAGVIRQPTVLYRQHTKNDVGAKRFGWRYIWEKFQKSHSLYPNLVQARGLWERHRDSLTEKQNKLLSVFLSLPERPLWTRLPLMFFWRIGKHSFSRNLGLVRAHFDPDLE